jgi:hypothetical protein
MQDQTTAINEAIEVAWQALISNGEKWSGIDLTIRALEEIGRRKIPIDRSTVSEVLAIVVRDGLLRTRESEMLFQRYGEVKLSELELFDAFEELEVEGIVNRAFEESGP